MISSDLPPGAPANSGDVSAQPRWPSRQQALGLLGAFLLGACLCGGAGLAIGGLAGQHRSGYGPQQDGRDGWHRRDDEERYRRDRDFWPYPILPVPAPTAPAVPEPSVSPTRSASPTPTTSPS